MVIERGYVYTYTQFGWQALENIKVFSEFKTDLLSINTINKVTGFIFFKIKLIYTWKLSIYSLFLRAHPWKAAILYPQSNTVRFQKK